MNFEVGDRVRFKRDMLERAESLFRVLDVPMTIVAKMGMENTTTNFFAYNAVSDRCPCCGHQQHVNGFGAIWFERLEETNDLPNDG